MTDFATLTVDIDGSIGRLTLDRPQQLNAVSRQMLDELVAAAAWFDAQRDVKVVVVAGAGRAFSAGFDLGDFSDPDPHVPPREAADKGRLVAEALTGMQAVTIAAVHGWCVGAGVVIVAACDLRVAADDARFSIPEVDLGIPLAWGGIPRLVRELGPAVTKELVLTCRPFSASEALALRFVNRVVPATDLAAATDALAQDLAAKSSFTLTTTKHAVNEANEALVPTTGAWADADLLVRAMHDPESREAGRAYLARRRGQ